MLHKIKMLPTGAFKICSRADFHCLMAVECIRGFFSGIISLIMGYISVEDAMMFSPPAG